jgi:HEAT repeat protein
MRIEDKILRLCVRATFLVAMQLSLTPVAMPTQTNARPELTRLRDGNPLNRIETLLELRRKGLSDQQTVEALIECILGEENSYVREVASEVLGSIRAQAADFAPRIVGVLKNSEQSADRRARAAQILGAIGSAAPDSVGPLVDVLGGSGRASPAVREAAAFALLNFSRLPAAFVPQVEEAAFDPQLSLNLRESAMQCLANTGRDAVSSLPRLTTVLNDRKTNVLLRREAAFSLGAIGSDAQTRLPTDALIGVSNDENEPLALRVQTVFALQSMQSFAIGALPSLAKLVTPRDHPRELRLAAITAIQVAGQGTRRFSEDLTRIAVDSTDDLQVRVKAAQALGVVRCGPAQTFQMANVAADLREPPQLRMAAIAVIQVGDFGSSLQPLLLTILKESKQDPNVRRSAAQLLSQVRPLPKPILPVFVTIINDPNADQSLRWAVTSASGSAGPDAAEVVPTLVRALSESPDLQLRREACGAILGIQRNAKNAVPVLVRIINDSQDDPELRRGAVSTLGGLASQDESIASDALPVLVKVLKYSEDRQMRILSMAYLSQIDVSGTSVDSVLVEMAEDENQNVEGRSAAVSALGRIGQHQNISVALPALLRIIRDAHQQSQLRETAASALMEIRPKAQEAIPVLIDAIHESDQREFRISAAMALGVVGEDSAPAASALAGVLADKNLDFGLRAAAAQALGKTGLVARPYLPSLYESLKDEQLAANALRGFVSFGAQAVARGDTNSIDELARAANLAAERPGLASLQDREFNRYVATLQSDVTSLRRQAAMQTRQAFLNSMKWAARNWYYFVVPAWFLVCVLIFVFRPIWLLSIGDAAISVKGLLWSFVPIDWLILPPVLRFHNRSLDAWVRKEIPTIRRNFSNLPTVLDREIYIELPVRINDQLVGQFGPSGIRSAFAEPRTTILIAGEGGAGKTSVACQIGKWGLGEADIPDFSSHLMLPVLIEGDIDEQVADGSDAFLQAVRGRVQGLLDSNKPLSEPMIQSLLFNKRILVIVDGYSEMSEGSRAMIRPLDPIFSANALVLTSRHEDSFSEVKHSSIRPERLAKGSLAKFMEAYLQRLGKEGILSNLEFQERANGLQQLVGERRVTPLFAELYIKLVVASKEGIAGANLPRTVPELVLEYLNCINRGITSEKKKADYEVHRIAKVVASECVMPLLRPAPAKIPTILTALGGRQDSSEDLTYINTNLGLIQTLLPGNEIHFALDPLAEYLAAIRLIEENGTDRGKWERFFELAQHKSGSISEIRGFLEAISDCCRLEKVGTFPRDIVFPKITSWMQSEESSGRVKPDTKPASRTTRKQISSTAKR